MSKPNIKSQTYKFEWGQRIWRVWKPGLSAEELVVVLMIADRTIMWGKVWEVITLEQFTNGVYNRDCTERYSPGTGFSRKGVIRILQRLLRTGAILRMDGETPTSPVCYAINTKWVPKMKLKLPKRQKNWLPTVTSDSDSGSP